MEGLRRGRAAYIALPFWKNLPTILRSTFAVSRHPDENEIDPYVPAEALPSARERAMGFWDHLDELRGTIIKSITVFVVFAVLIGFFATEFNHALLWPLHFVAETYPGFDTRLGTLSIMEVFNMIIQMCVFGGLLLAAPFILFFIGQFVAPALTEREMKAVLPLCFAAMVLFLIGAAFSFFLLMPSTIKIAIELNNAFELENRWTAGNYYNTLTWLVVGTGGVFQFPLVIVLLVWLGIMTTAFLKKYRRHAIVVIFILAAIVTPTPDPFTQTLFAAPLYGLYEIAIVVSRRVEKKRAKAAAV
jgi:sec-independent protein translocase protein TatC